MPLQLQTPFKRCSYYSSVLALCLALVACQPSSLPTSSDPVSTPDPIQEQLDRGAESNLLSAQNAMDQARNSYFNLSGRWPTVATDVQAYQSISTQLLPPMLLAANSLTTVSTDSTTAQTLRQDFKELYTDSTAQMLNGINNNMQIYQNSFESSQTLFQDQSMAEQALKDLAGIFVATEQTERYIAELGQFSTLFPNQEHQNALNGIRSQQTVVINGVINFTSQGASQNAIQQAYLTIVQSLTNPALFNQLVQLANKAVGPTNVASRQEQLTPDQPNPSSVVIVIKEGPTSYRLLSVENGRISNRLAQDSRGLSAADILYQSNVVVVTNPTTPVSPTPTVSP